MLYHNLPILDNINQASINQTCRVLYCSHLDVSSVFWLEEGGRVTKRHSTMHFSLGTPTFTRGHPYF